ncbi:hypothetical protein ONZ45_g511 [Pleurotus djamor]|nr:hypothetical protein ONZ45_g511 [Pleurotus djamor]
MLSSSLRRILPVSRSLRQPRYFSTTHSILSSSSSTPPPELDEGERNIHAKLTERFSPTQLQVQDISGFRTSSSWKTHYPPCIELDDNPDLKLLILSQYPYFLERIKAIRTCKSRGLVLIGHPGIGKSTFLLYLLIHHLFHKEPVIYSRNGLTLYFSAQGVVSFNDLVALNDESLQCVPALVDDGPPHPNLVISQPFPIHATSPQLAKYGYWYKKRSATMLVMNPLTVDELFAICSLTAPNITRNQIKTLTSLYGYNKHIIQAALANGEQSHVQNLTSLIARLEITTLVDLLDMPLVADPLVSRYIIQTFRDSPLPDPVSRQYLSSDSMVHSVVSRHVFRLLWNHFRLKDPDACQRLTSVASSRGWAFENWCHEQLSDGQAPLRLQRMKIFGDSIIMTHGDNDVHLLDIHPTSVSTYPCTMPVARTREAATYYIPHECNNPAFDAHYRLSDELGVGFRMTVCPKQTLKPQDLSLLSRRLGTKKQYFVFVIPKGHVFRCPAPPSRWRSIFEFYTCELPFKLSGMFYPGEDEDRVQAFDRAESPFTPDDPGVADDNDEDDRLELSRQPA